MNTILGFLGINVVDQNDPPSPPVQFDCDNQTVGSVYNDHYHQELPRVKCDCNAAGSSNNSSSLFYRLFAGWL